MRAPEGRAYGDDVADEVIDHLRAICADLPDAVEQAAWKGVRWRVRNQTFAHILTITDVDTEQRTVLVFRAEGEDLDALSHAGPPFFVLGWGRNALGLDLDDDTDWDEVRELITDSFCVMAPKKLAALVDRPTDAGETN